MPRIQMTPVARFSLYFLRAYLILLLLLILVKFIRVYSTRTHGNHAAPAATAPAVAP